MMSLYRRGRRLIRKLQPRLPRTPNEPLDVTLARARRAWMKEMRPHQDRNGRVLLPDYPQLAAEHLTNCRVVPLREDILAQVPEGMVCAEVGVFRGDFSQAILDICRPAELHLVDDDLRTYDVAGRFAEQIASGTVKLHQGDSATTLATLEDGRFAMIYIDADHSHAGVARDIAAAHRKLRADGLLVFNDYTFWSSAECLPYGVMHAVHEFCLAEGWEFALLALNWYGYFDVALRRRRPG
jgi:SAM-dependent methyltransferase